jgi:hypothetical protein
MTTTQGPALADLLSAKRAAIEAVPEVAEAITEVEEAINPVMTITEHGEIVPANDPPPQPAQVVEYAPQYPSIPPKVVGGLPYVRDYMKLARTIHSTEMVPAAFRGRPDAILATFLRGYEMGFGPMQSLDSFNVIEGKVGLTAESMRALIMDNGHQIMLDDLMHEGQLYGIQAKCHRKDWPADMWATLAFTMDDARRAGLLAPSRSGKPTAWQKYPRAMMDARATSAAGRRYFPDVLAGMSYTPEEIRDFSGDDREEQPSPTQPTPPTTVGASGAPATTSTLPETGTSNAPQTEPADGTASEPVSTPSQSNGDSTQSAPPKTTRARKSTVAPADAAGTSAPTPSPETAANGSDVRLEMRKGLTAVIAGLDPMHQPLVRAYLAQQGYGDITKLDEAKIQEAINIAAGWPDTAQDAADAADEEQRIVDAEIMDEPEQLSF